MTKTLESSENLALIKFERTTHTSLEGLRRELKKNNAKVNVIKNTLMEKAIHKLSQEKPTLKAFSEKALPLKETTALVTFDSDWSNGLKAFNTYTQKDTSLSFKVGVLDGTVYIKEELKKIANLPSRLELIAKVIGGMKSPASSLVRNMKFNMQRFVYVLSEKAKQGV